MSFDYSGPSGRCSIRRLPEDLEYLKSVADGELQIASRTQDDNKWIVAYVMDDGPVRYYLYDRAEQEGRVPVHQPQVARRAAAGEDAPGGDQVARRQGAGQLPDAAQGSRSG